MTDLAVDTLRRHQAALLDMVRQTDPADWDQPSNCAGWTARDVLAHLVQTFRMLLEPDALPPADPSGNLERTNDLQVDAISELRLAELVADYERLSTTALEVLATMQDRHDPVDLGQLGTHPIHLIANAYAFDHYVHLRHDLLGPAGPFDHPVVPAEPDDLTAVTDWIIAGIPQMSPRAVVEPFELTVTGPGSRTEHLGPPGEPQFTVATTGDDLVLWATRRSAASDLPIVITGDEGAASRLFDVIHVI